MLYVLMTHTFLMTSANLLLPSIPKNGSLQNAKAAFNQSKRRNFNQPIADVVRIAGRNMESIYDHNLFDITKELAGFHATEVSNAFHYSPDLISYIQKHSYLEVTWCFKLYTTMTFYKTYLKIAAMETSNKFTIYSATGSKEWPSGHDPRHVVCSVISKQPISSGLYEQFLVPARCKVLGITAIEFQSVKKFLDIEQLATRYEFAQALRIELVERRLQPKLVQAIVKRLKLITLNSIPNRTKHNAKNQQQNSVFRMMADSYRVSQRSLASVIQFYTQNPRKSMMMNDASFKSLTHFLNVGMNTSFGDIFFKLTASMSQFKRRMDTSMILILDKNRITKSFVNKTILNVMISIAKEPRDILSSFYEIPVDVQKFIERTRLFQLHRMMGQTVLRIEHLSLNYLMTLLKKQTARNLRNGTLAFNANEVNNEYYASVKNIISTVKLPDFLRMYKRPWTSNQIYQQTLMSLSKQQGLSGREFVRIYDMEGKTFAEVSRFSNFTVAKVKSKVHNDVLVYTVHQLAHTIRELLKLSISTQKPAIIKTMAATTTTTLRHRNASTSARPMKMNNETEQRDVLASALDKRRGTNHSSLYAGPIIGCVFGSLALLIGYIYRSKRKERFHKKDPS